LQEFKVGDIMEFKGPLGEFIWAGPGLARWKGVERKVRNIGMIAAGSGITPILQTLRGVFLDDNDTETRVWVLDANKTEEDIRKPFSKLLQV
jgi:nitrate reductase (NAD(P)H)